MTQGPPAVTHLIAQRQAYECVSAYIPAATATAGQEQEPGMSGMLVATGIRIPPCSIKTNTPV